VFVFGGWELRVHRRSVVDAELPCLISEITFVSTLGRCSCLYIRRLVPFTYLQGGLLHSVSPGIRTYHEAATRASILSQRLLSRWSFNNLACLGTGNRTAGGQATVRVLQRKFPVRDKFPTKLETVCSPQTRRIMAPPAPSKRQFYAHRLGQRGSRTAKQE